MRKIPQDIVGDIAILKFKERTPFLIRKFLAYRFLKKNKTLTTVLEKTEKFSGELRIQKTRHLAGLKTKEANYKENGCVFKFNIDETYFSPRLSNERKVVSEEVLKVLKKKKNAKVLVMFSGVGPYPIVLAKGLKSLGIKAEIYSNELNKKANEYEKKNIILNKVGEYIFQIPGDANKIPERASDKRKGKLKAELRAGGKSARTKGREEEVKIPEKFDVILMPRPNISDTFLRSALKISRRGTVIFYHGFGTREGVIDEIKKETRGKIGKIEIRKAGDIGPRIFRWQCRFKVLKG